MSNATRQPRRTPAPIRSAADQLRRGAADVDVDAPDRHAVFGRSPPAATDRSRSSTRRSRALAAQRADDGARLQAAAAQLGKVRAGHHQHAWLHAHRARISANAAGGPPDVVLLRDRGVLRRRVQAALACAASSASIAAAIAGSSSGGITG